MRIAYLINSMEGGGAQTPLPAILRAVEAAGAEARIFALLRKDGKAIERLRDAGIEPQVFEGDAKDHFGAYHWARKAIAAYRPDAVWTSLVRATLVGQVIGRRLGVPVVSWQHSAFLKPWNARLLRWRQGASAFWIADSTPVAEMLRARVRVDAERIVTWPIFAADPAAPQARPGAGDDPLRIGTLGRLHVSKGYDLMIEATRRLEAMAPSPPPFEIHIGGIGPDEDALRRQADGVAAIHFAGFVSDTAAFLALLDIYAQPSRREGFCVAAHEAMQAGLPVVVSDTGEMPNSVVDGETGRVVPAGNADALADALNDLLRNRTHLAAMGDAGRARVLDSYPQARFEAVASEIVERLRGLVR